MAARTHNRRHRLRQGPALTRARAAWVTALLPFLLVLIGTALLTRADAFVYLLYTLLLVYLLSRLWARRSLAALSVARRHDARAFLDQDVRVEVEARNRGWLPVLWLYLDDAAPVELVSGGRFHHVVSLMPHESAHLAYDLSARRRGYYRFGPLTARAGDLLGTVAYEARHAPGDALIVYPKIIPLRAALPSHSPLGTLASRERLFEDPSRVQGVRDYQPGDSLRRMDWKTSGRLGRLQVRRCEPAIALETALVLNLAGDDYTGVARYQATELGIVVAASLAVHIAEQRQAVGLATNGRDPLEGEEEKAQGAGRSAQGEEEKAQSAERRAQGEGGTGQAAEARGRGTGAVPAAAPPGAVAQPAALPPRKGREHAMRLLDLLARIEVAPGEEAVPFLDLLVGTAGRAPRLPWGGTVVAITGREVDGLMEALLVLRRRGLEVVLVLTCPEGDWSLTAARAGQIGARAVSICSERDLEAWR